MTTKKYLITIRLLSIGGLLALFSLSLFHLIRPTQTTYAAAITQFNQSLAAVSPVATPEVVFNVTRFDDPAPGNCDPNDCSLREAIKAANLALGGTINLPSGVYTLTITGIDEDNNATGDLDINSSLTLNGDATSSTEIRGDTGWNDRIFHIFAGLSVNINHVAVEFGHSNFWGGGIYNYGGLLTLNHCGIFDNQAVAGGGIMNDNNGILAVTNCQIDFNEASNNGGGIYNGSGIVTVNDSHFFSNNNGAIVNWGELSVTNSEFVINAGGWGGAIGNSGTAVLSDCDFTGNMASITGGGVANTGANTLMTIQSSTFMSNTAVSSGGALTNVGIMSLTQNTFRYNSSPGSSGAIGNSGQLTLNQVTIAENHADGIYDTGGGINNSGIITITNSQITDNRTQTGWGGGLVNTHSGTATLSQTEISHNQAQRGGGIYNFGTLTATWSDIAENTSYSAIDSGAGIYNAHRLTLVNTAVFSNTANGQGGGILNGVTAFYPTTGTLTMTHSTLSGNSALNSHGGGLAILTGTVTLENSTLSGNLTARHGGGIYHENGTIWLNNVTIAANNANFSLSQGGGFFTGGGQFFLRNSLIAANHNSNNNNNSPDCAGSPTSQGYNLIENITGCNFSASTGDITGQNAFLEPLTDNGGDTLTHALQGGSPAIDAANPAVPGSGGMSCTAVDQRGETRPTDGNDDGQPRCDIGAYESGPVFRFIYLPMLTRQ